MNPRLQHLARLHGIRLSYHDIWGKSHEASAQVLVNLLAAMGVTARDDDAIEAAIDAHALERWGQVLPHASAVGQVTAGTSTVTLPLRLPAALDNASLSWTLDEEHGASRRGQVVPAHLAVSDRAVVRGAQHIERAWPVPLPSTIGYHRLSLAHEREVLGTGLLISAPSTCYVPPALEGGARTWGCTAQLYALRSQRNWGIGDYGDLAALVDLWGAQGASLVGVSPLHAMFAHNPAHASPYSPSSRLFLNTLYLDIEAIEDFADCDEARQHVHGGGFAARLAALRGSDHIDHAGVAAAKREVLDILHAHFVTHHLARDSARARQFQDFVRAGGEALRRHTLAEALQEKFHAEDASIWGWPVWPCAYRSPDGDAARAFEREHADRVGFHAWLQWQADRQLAEVARRAREHGMGIGLYQDLAVSSDRAGSEAWADQALYAVGASIGAPPDAFNLQGQNWGLPPQVPGRLTQVAYAPFIHTLRAGMRHAGALRIDHVMALRRLYWIAQDADATQGAYVDYPFDDLLAIVRLESHRNRCLVIGEDLGTVPQEVRERLSSSGVLSYRLLYFERERDGAFVAPARQEPQALLAGSTHDLPTLAGWWAGEDLALRERLGLFPDPGTREEQTAQRAQDRTQLLLALEDSGLLPAGMRADAAEVPEMTPALGCAVHRHLARSAARIVVAQLEDVLGVREQVNLPGTTDSHPNWKRRLPLPLERWASDSRFSALVRMFREERGQATSASTAQRAAPAAQAVIPDATYRVQLNRDYTFRDATALVPHLAALGISHLYCSPFLRARAGSTHGYDVVDHAQINPEIGTRGDFDDLVRTLHDHHMGLLVDIVPNHMGVLGADNVWWLDVLEDGPASAYAGYFDIDWHAADPALTGKVLLPILGEHYGIALERGDIRLGFDAAHGRFALHCHEHLLPLDPRTFGGLIRRALQEHPMSADLRAQMLQLAEDFERLPAQDCEHPEDRARRRRDKSALKVRLAHLAASHDQLLQAIESLVHRLNGDPLRRASFDALDALIDAQAYRLAQWRAAADEINYRRFFDVNDLAALRMERPEVFEATHGFVLSLVAAGAIDGLRVDHPDGLDDPAGYFLRLQNRYAELAGFNAAPDAAPGAASTEGSTKPLYVVIEKIAASHEQVPLDWAVHGTTGYRFATVVNGVLIDTESKARLDRVWRAFTGDPAESFDDLARRCRHIVMEGALAGELTVLANALLRLAREDRRTRDFTLNSLRRALAEVVACFPVYRTYIVKKPSAQDRRYIEWAIGRARGVSLAADAGLFDFLRRVLLDRPLAGAPAGLGARYRAFARRLQQYTAPVAAKGIEDTALYRHHRLISVNDVGSEPDVFGISVAAFHAASRERSQHWPHTLLATSTHDAKRSEDVRARIDVISEVPAAWRLTVRRWSRLNRRHVREVDGMPAPSRADEYLLYQTLVGCLPPGPLDEAQLADCAGRVAQAMLKSAREAKLRTSWLNPDPAYEAALTEFVHALLTPRDSNLFLPDLQAKCAYFAWYGALNGITLATLKTLSPGVPDFYQGHEAIVLSLVDPDNRRPVNQARLLDSLAAAQALQAKPQRGASLRQLLGHAADGQAKFWATWCSLQLRRRRSDLFRHGDYLPLDVSGEHARHVLAFMRHRGDSRVIVVVARLYASLKLRVGRPPLGTVWGNTVLHLPGNDGEPTTPRGTRWVDVISGHTHEVADTTLPLARLLLDFPVAALEAQTARDSAPFRPAS